MEDSEVLRLIGQFLHERSYLDTLAALQKDRLDKPLHNVVGLMDVCLYGLSLVPYSMRAFSGRAFSADSMIKKTGELQSILGKH